MVCMSVQTPAKKGSVNDYDQLESAYTYLLQTILGL